MWCERWRLRTFGTRRTRPSPLVPPLLLQLRLGLRDRMRLAQGHRAQPGSQPGLSSHLTPRAMGSVTSLTLTPGQHCPPTARQAPSPQPSRHRCGSQDRGPARSPRPPESEAFPEPVWRLHSDLSPLSLPVYSTSWRKAAGAEFMRSGAKRGEKETTVG